VEIVATKHTAKEIPPVSVRLEQEDYEKLGKLSEKYPLYSRNKMIVAAVRQWVDAAWQYGVDANLQPLRKGA
jgi:metal-responsive CopG/Arc/MetJ family transcriptional regulator